MGLLFISNSFRVQWDWCGSIHDRRGIRKYRGAARVSLRDSQYEGLCYRLRNRYRVYISLGFKNDLNLKYYLLEQVSHKFVREQTQNVFDSILNLGKITPFPLVEPDEVMNTRTVTPENTGPPSSSSPYSSYTQNRSVTAINFSLQFAKKAILTFKHTASVILNL